MREAILTATRRLLDERRFDELSVADILTAADVARGSFYFYFASKQEVLAELTRRAVALGHEAAEPWFGDPADPREAVRHGIREGARLWRPSAWSRSPTRSGSSTCSPMCGRARWLAPQPPSRRDTFA